MAAAEFGFGPVYCETLSAVPGQFPVEPFNTVSNGVIVLFGLAGLYFVIRQAPRVLDLYVLCLFLAATGLGSGIWHGMRDGDALFWEVRSGLYYLFTLVFCWARRLWTIPGAAVAVVLFYYGFDYFSTYGNEMLGIGGRWVAITPLVVGFGIALILHTWFRSKEAALLGGLALALALIAVSFRTADLAVCGYLPMGTHFLWHMFLSAAGFVGILTLIRLPAKAPNWLRPRTAREAAE